MKTKKKKILFISIIIVVIVISIAIIYEQTRLQNRVPKKEKLVVVGMDIYQLQRSFHYEHGRYANSLHELDPNLNFINLNDKKFIKRHGIVKIIFTKESFIIKYPNLLKCTDIGVKENEYTILVVGNLDRDSLPHVEIVRNGIGPTTLISDEYDNILERCE